MIIDQLPTISNVQNSDELPIERGQTTYKTTVGEVVGAVSKIVADEYDNTTTYAVGDYCVYEGTLYVCNTDISTAEEWNATHWTATNVTDEIPSAYTTNPAMDGTASPGSSTCWAKGDHVHPHDTSKADTGLGITGATVGKVPVISAVDGNGVPTAFDAGDGGDVTADMLGIVVNGNSTPVGASVEQYVIVKNSTISGITDGLYTAAQEIHANTAIDSTYLTPVSDGGMNDLLSRTQRHLLWTNASPASDFAAQTVSLDLSVYDLVFIEYAQDKLNDNYYYSYFFKIDGKIHMAIGFAGGKMARRFNTVNASGIYFGEGQIASTYASTFTTANTNMIPINIYGIK